MRRFFCLGTGFAASFSKCIVRPLEPTWVSFEIILTRKERHSVQIVPPLFVDLDCRLLVGLTIGSEPLFVCMGDHLADILGVDGIQDCHEVVSVRESILRVFILQILHHLFVVFEFGKDVLHTELIEFGSLADLALTHLEQLLVPFENLAKEIAIDRCRGRHKELQLQEKG